MRTIQTMVVAFAFGAWSGIPGLAFAPSTNGSGVAWVSESAEGWAGSAQTDGSGSSVHLTGTFGPSVDTHNGVGVTAYIGLLDPIAVLEEPPTPTFSPSSTETPTEMIPTVTLSLTPTGLFATPSPTDTQPMISTPTLTPTGTSLTLTPTESCLVTDRSYDLNEDGIVDAEDLIALLTSVREGTSLYDLNCDGVTDDLDLRVFSVKWRIVP
ncbi:MAG: hypothetical protein HUU16_13300 [Candidatus Omnitrophica bacterium]|nr:hypothetical protein [bacterium]NUN97140.1 hypothetical protein [Candidatus Omnitrophota bacterium]